MTNRSSLNITNLDFDQIKNSLKEFLKSSDSPIKDYNYEGSAFNILLDVLAANTHYQSLYTNFVANEMFLDSAMLRSSVVSIAKELGYTPLSAKASRATISVSVAPKIGTQETISIPSGTKFLINSNDTVFNYINTTEQFLEWDNDKGSYVGEFEVICGSFFSEQYVNDGTTKFYVSADGADISTLTVSVQNSVNDTTTLTYIPFTKIVDATPGSTLYFIKETDLHRYEITFGDGVIGKQITNGNIINISYVAVDYDAPFGAKDFLRSADFYPGYTVSIETIVPTTMPSEAEQVDSIKRNIQRYNQSQDRSVISADYEYHILQSFPEIRDVIVWGGEDNNPPQYGKVFISAVLNTLSTIPTSIRLKIAEEVKKKSTINIRPEVVNADYVSIILQGFVRYNQEQTGLSASQIKSEIIDKISEYSETYLEKFNSNFSYSGLSTFISSADPSITSVVFGFYVTNSIRIEPDIISAYSKYFRNTIKQGSFVSERYFKNGDASSTYNILDENGILKEYFYLNSLEENKEYVREVGTINYETGEVMLKDLIGTPTNGTPNIKLTFETEGSEILSNFNQILSIDKGQSAVRITVRGQ